MAAPTNVETGVNTSTTRFRIGRPDRTIDWITGPRPAPYQSVVQVKHFRSPGPEHGASSNISRFVGQTWL